VPRGASPCCRRTLFLSLFIPYAMARFCAPAPQRPLLPILNTHELAPQTVAVPQLDKNTGGCGSVFDLGAFSDDGEGSDDDSEFAPEDDADSSAASDDDEFELLTPDWGDGPFPSSPPMRCAADPVRAAARAAASAHTIGAAADAAPPPPRWRFAATLAKVLSPKSAPCRRMTAPAPPAARSNVGRAMMYGSVPPKPHVRSIIARSGARPQSYRLACSA
jgi:hypothetical protein